MTEDSAVYIYYYAYYLSRTGLYAGRAHDNHVSLSHFQHCEKKLEEKKKIEADQMTDGI